MTRPLDRLIEMKIYNIENPHVKGAMRKIKAELERVGAPMLDPQQLADVARGHLRARRNFKRMRKND